MRKIISLLAFLLMTAPVMAASMVNIITSTSLCGNVNEVTVSYASDVNRVRAFGLIVQCDDPCCAITQVVPVDANYRIYPSQIQIDDGTVTDYGTPYDPCDLGDANVAIDMASLYTFDANYAGDANAGYGMQPGLTGTLFKFYVERPNGTDPNGCVTVSENYITGGVVMEDPCEVPTVVSDGNCFVHGCYNWPSQTQAECDEWIAVGVPDCWCYPRQCLGDADGLPYGKPNYWVAAPDLAILKSAWQIPDGPVGSPGACADFDHLPYGKANWRVAAPDLAILKSYWQINNGPEPGCAPGNKIPW